MNFLTAEELAEVWLRVRPPHLLIFCTEADVERLRAVVAAAGLIGAQVSVDVSPLARAGEAIVVDASVLDIPDDLRP